MTEYETLRENLAKLAEHFLSIERSFDGDYDNTVYLNLYAYIALVHSEIEDFFEKSSLSVAKRAYEAYISSGKISRALLGLVCYSGIKFDVPPDSLHKKNKQDDLPLEARIKRAYSIFYNAVRKNNGIKEKDVLGLLLPIGFPIDKIDDVILTELDNFGSERGTIAHTSSLALEHKTDPFNKKESIDALVVNLENIYNIMQLGVE